MIRALQALERGCAWFGRIAAWTVPLLVAGVCIGVLFAQLRINELAHWGIRLPVLGDRLTLNGLNDLQWHLFAVMVMLGIPYTLHENRHVCVDVFAAMLSARTRKAITLVLDVVALLPFALVMTWFSWKYMLASYSSGEGSSYGGLSDLWVVKAVMPLGFGLLSLLGAARALRLAIELATGRGEGGASGHDDGGASGRKASTATPANA